MGLNSEFGTRRKYLGSKSNDLSLDLGWNWKGSWMDLEGYLPGARRIAALDLERWWDKLEKIWELVSRFEGQIHSVSSLIHSNFIRNPFQFYSRPIWASSGILKLAQSRASWDLFHFWAPQILKFYCHCHHTKFMMVMSFSTSSHTKILDFSPVQIIHRPSGEKRKKSTQNLTMHENLYLKKNKNIEISLRVFLFSRTKK